MRLSALQEIAQRLRAHPAAVHSRHLLIRGKKRLVHTPRDEGLRQALVALVGCIELPIATTMRRDEIAHGYIPGRSAYTNARCHVGATWVQRLDIKNFFPSISAAHVEAALTEAGMGEDAARFIVAFTTFGGSLPLGFIPSPLLSNLVATNIDIGLLRLARERGLCVTRYADDITLSGEELFDCHDDVATIVGESGFALNLAKMSAGTPRNGFRVTGYVLSTGDPRLPRHVKRETRQDLYSVERIGITQQAKHRGRTPQSFGRRLLARLGSIRQSEPLVYERMRSDFPLAFERLDALRESARVTREQKSAMLERELLSMPSAAPAYYTPLHPAGR
ncbi:Reverse transcriptase (RNA-dependent DNA polymerase) [Microbacterium azadirachtae]|uniref:RNA-directed DNA polymerase n=1 Tax=Microbacterium azadirachtae TaxID=582680 RepID=A0A1I6HYL1_9MICO|nr:Reverse transcriptase (RNA-dependent DNA polymerase) [Microbacterium azadirachtae]